MEDMKKFLSTDLIGKKVVFFEEINSTQIKAKELAEEDIENGTIVLTDYQTAGLGTHGRKWHSERMDNITFTLIIYPKCSINNLDSLTIDIAKCMIEAIYKETFERLEIKKPNDIMCKGKKVGGILTQIITVRRKNKVFVNRNRHKC